MFHDPIAKNKIETLIGEREWLASLDDDGFVKRRIQLYSWNDVDTNSARTFFAKKEQPAAQRRTFLKREHHAAAFTEIKNHRSFGKHRYDALIELDRGVVLHVAARSDFWMIFVDKVLTRLHPRSPANGSAANCGASACSRR